MAAMNDDDPRDVDFPLEGALDIDLLELSNLCDIHTEMLLEFVQHGVLNPRAGSGPGDWRFGTSEVRRGRVALRLQRELRVNLAGAALALDLLEELRGARQRVRTLEQLLAR